LLYVKFKLPQPPNNELSKVFLKLSTNLNLVLLFFPTKKLLHLLAVREMAKALWVTIYQEIFLELINLISNRNIEKVFMQTCYFYNEYLHDKTYKMFKIQER
jgi:hypothetical protein